MKLYYLAFSARGLALAQKLAASLGGEAARCGGPVTLQSWTEAHFETGAGLVYIGACGIAVRAAAPFLQSKETDPAVVAVDEQGRYAVPLLSGHLGGANALARAIGRACGAQPVLTAATDAGGLFPVAFDSFYSSSKAAVDMLVKSAEMELEPFHIHVSAVQPGGTSTGFTFKRKVYGDEENRDYSAKVKRAAAVLADMEQGGMSAGEVAKQVADVFCDKKPPLLIQCGAWNKLFAAANRILPGTTSLYINKKIYKQ